MLLVNDGGAAVTPADHTLRPPPFAFRNAIGKYRGSEGSIRPEEGNLVNPTAGEQPSWNDVIEIVEKDLTREFQGTRSPEAIEAVARESVTSFAAEEVRIRAFVPVLAGKAARRRLKETG
jgi:Protein-tyrosine-phosphatase-like, N-terminal domain